MVVTNRALMHPPPDANRSRRVLRRADATMLLVDRQIDRLETLLQEVRSTEQFVEDRRSRDLGHRLDRRHS